MPQPHSPPQQIGRYRITGKLGEGSMSIVYKAFDAEINRNIAIKLMRPEVVLDPEFRARFVSEAKAAGKLTHPNIVTIFDVGECELGPYIAMEYLDGSPLDEVAGEDRPLPLTEVLEIGIQLADALNYSHENGIVHRDVKPSNIIRLADGKTVRITDFGIAHIEDANKMHHTVSGTLLGTPQYMSPEQIEGKPVDGRSDLFSVGVILYQLTSGQRPFTARTLAALYAQIVGEDPAALKGLAPDAPAGLLHVVEKLLQKDPEKRFRNGRELCDALRSLVEEMQARERRQAEARQIPLRIRFTMSLAVLVAIAMVISALVIHRQEMGAMTRLAQEFGSSLARFVATQTAEPMVIGDWVAVEFFVAETKERQEITHLQIVDRKGIVRGSTRTEEQGKPYKAIPGGRLVGGEGELSIHEVETDGPPILDFEVPILYQKREMGRVHLGLSEASLEQAADLTLYTMIGLILALVVTVLVAAYVLSAPISSALQILHEAMQQAARGNLAQRISEQRKDELGQMFNAFNEMAERLERLKDQWSAPSDAGGHTIPGTLTVPPGYRNPDGTDIQLPDEAPTRIAGPEEVAGPAGERP